MMGQNFESDTRLSLRARGLMCYLLTLPPGAPMGAEALAKDLPEGRDAITKALRELRDSGYLRRTRTGNQVIGLSGNPTTGLSGNQGSGSPENPLVIDRESITTTSISLGAPEIPVSRLTERIRRVMTRLNIAVSQPWQDAWEQALANEQGYGAEEHLVQWLLDGEVKGHKTRPTVWLHYFIKNRDEWLAERAQLERTASLNDEGWDREVRQNMALRKTPFLSIEERERMLAEGRS